MSELPLGFQLSATAADFRGKRDGRLDLAMVASAEPAVAAGVFTTNIFQAAPVTIAREHLRNASAVQLGRPWAMVVNTGQANACTGAIGEANCRQSLEWLGQAAGLNPEDILPASTGVIGAQMDMEKWRRALPALVDNLGKTDLPTFARAIMTTDAFPKFTSRTIELSGGTITLAGAAKGAGMICPNMATMIALVLCDAHVAGKAWQEMFERAVAATFNRVSVDGDTSTNDTLIGLANGASGVSLSGSDLTVLEDELKGVLGELAYLLVKDGEGATKVVHLTVTGARNTAEAESIARTVGHSQLVKTAMFGRDPNWGRIVAAAGRAGVDFAPEDLTVTLCGVKLFENGQPTNLDFDALLREPLSQTDIRLELELKQGYGESTLYFSDLTHDYVTINADYRS